MAQAGTMRPHQQDDRRTAASQVTACSTYPIRSLQSNQPTKDAYPCSRPKRPGWLERLINNTDHPKSIRGSRRHLSSAISTPSRIWFGVAAGRSKSSRHNMQSTRHRRHHVQDWQRCLHRPGQCRTGEVEVQCTCLKSSRACFVSVRKSDALESDYRLTASFNRRSLAVTTTMSAFIPT